MYSPHSKLIVSLVQLRSNLSWLASEVKGSPEFYRFYSSLKPGSVERRMVDSALDALKANMTVGVKIPKPQWPRFYTRTYRINNLWKMDLLKGARLTYTIL